MYMGSRVSEGNGGTEDIENRVVKARGLFLKLKKIWISNSIDQLTNYSQAIQDTW